MSPPPPLRAWEGRIGDGGEAPWARGLSVCAGWDLCFCLSPVSGVCFVLRTIRVASEPPLITMEPGRKPLLLSDLWHMPACVCGGREVGETWARPGGWRRLPEAIAQIGPMAGKGRRQTSAAPAQGPEKFGLFQAQAGGPGLLLQGREEGSRLGLGRGHCRHPKAPSVADRGLPACGPRQTGLGWAEPLCALESWGQSQKLAWVSRCSVRAETRRLQLCVSP